MHINNKHLSEYGAKLLDRHIYLSEMKIDSFWPEGSISPYIGDEIKYKYKTLVVDIEFKGNPNDIEQNKSRLLKEMSISTIKFAKIDNFYSGHIAGTGIKSKVTGFEVVTITMFVIEHEEEIINTFNRSETTAIYLHSNAITPVILEVKPSINLVTATITGLGEDITLKNLTAGQMVTIDGEKGLVTENGQNKWLDYDSWGFPKLEPGENKITVDRVTLDITIKYKPRWI